MAKAKIHYECTACGAEYMKWEGQCRQCGAWNTIEEALPEVLSAVTGVHAAGNAHRTADYSAQIRELADVGVNEDIRYDTGISEFNRVLGGGLVKGSVVLLGGEPGIGKSTLLLQVCQYLGESHSVLYVSGEESARQIKLRAMRLGVDTESLYLLTLSDAEAVCSTIMETEPDIVIIDSIQTMHISGIVSGSGSVPQVRECTNLFMQTAKAKEIPILLVGHVTKEGSIAGPKVMEHIVDAVLIFEGERYQSMRILRAVKNRFGSTNEIGVFEMNDKGLSEVKNPSAMLLDGRPIGVSGTCVGCMIEGSRPILAEIQALVSKSNLSSPRRTATGYDYNRVCILLAVLEKRLGLYFGALDVYLNIIGGFRLNEPAGDLAVALSLYSALMDKPIPETVIAFGEIGLGGELRSVSNAALRIQEAERLGFRMCILPRQTLKSLQTERFAMQLEGVSNLKQAFAVLEKCSAQMKKDT
ncbi:MAG: DNA repair protein RadA [Oscillospiraceae bacterium]|nr:DNA repair protein RadA [Oscillospiraceae bacterium]